MCPLTNDALRAVVYGNNPGSVDDRRFIQKRERLQKRSGKQEALECGLVEKIEQLIAIIRRERNHRDSDSLARFIV
jgi:hypothetical protein